MGLVEGFWPGAPLPKAIVGGEELQLRAGKGVLRLCQGMLTHKYTLREPAGPFPFGPEALNQDCLTRK